MNRGSRITPLLPSERQATDFEGGKRMVDGARGRERERERERESEK